MAEMDKQKGGWFQGLTAPGILWNAVKVSLVVGTVLNLVNQGPQLLAGQGLQVGRALLNYLVPFCVAAYSGARAVTVRGPSGRDVPGDENLETRASVSDRVRSSG